MESFSTEVERTAHVVSTIASSLVDEMHESVARACRPALLELTRLLKRTTISIVRSPLMPTAILCVPALLGDGLHSESDLVKWLSHSGRSTHRREEILEHVMTIVTAVARIDACGLAPRLLVIELEDGYEGEDEDAVAPDLARFHEEPVDGPDQGLRTMTIEGRDRRIFQMSDSSLAYPDALRIGTDGGRTLLTRPQIASLMPALLRFLRTGSIGRERTS